MHAPIRFPSQAVARWSSPLRRARASSASCVRRSRGSSSHLRLSSPPKRRVSSHSTQAFSPSDTHSSAPPSITRPTRPSGAAPTLRSPEPSRATIAAPGTLLPQLSDPTFGRRPLSSAPPRRRPAAPDSRPRRPRTSGRHVCPSGREDRLRRLSAAADSAWLAGRTAHALALIEEALAHAADDARCGELLYLRGTIQHFGGDPARAAATLEEAAALLADSNRHLACLSLTQASGSLLASGEVTRAVALSERLIEIGDADQPDEYLLTSLGRGAALLMDGRPEEGLPFLRDAAKAIREHELLSSNPRNLPWAALAAYWLGDIASMASYAAAAAPWAREHAAVATLTFAARLLARSQLITGHWAPARASLAESLDGARIAGLMNQQVQSLGMLAWLDAAQGREEDCRRKVEEARVLADSVNLRWRNDLLRALVLLELGAGLVEPSVLDRLRSVLGDPPLLRDPPASATAPDFVEALVRAGEAAAATELLVPFADEAERVGQPSARAVVLRCRGLLAAEDSYAREFQRASRPPRPRRERLRDRAHAARLR